MDKNSLTFINTRLLVFSIPLVNLLLFGIYYNSHQEEPFWNQLWAYFDSGIFKLVTGSLIIPLIISLLEKRYKFFENIQKQREERKKALDEQNKKNRLDSINETLRMWQDLYNMTSEIVFFNPKSDDEKILRDTIVKLARFSSTAEQTVNKWSHQFQDLSQRDTDNFLQLINIVFQSGFSTAAYLLKEKKDDKKRKMQSVLFQILDQIKSITNHRMMNIFTHVNQLMDLRENEADKTEIEKTRQLLDLELDGLKNWTNAIIAKEQEYDNFLSPHKGQEFDEVRKTARLIENWLKEDESRQVNQSSEFNTFLSQYEKIDLNNRLEWLYNLYTVEYMEGLANWLSVESACSYIRGRAFSSW